MKKTNNDSNSATVIIDSPKEKIWAIQADINNWNAWDSGVIFADGEMKENAIGLIKTPHRPESKMKFIEVNECKNYKIKVKVFLCSFVINHVINEISKNRCELSYEIKFSGLLAGIFSKSLGKKIAGGFARTLTECKLKSEKDSNKTVLITGGSSGIGYEFAKTYLQKKYDVIIVGKNKGKLETAQKQLAKEYQNKIEAINEDLSNINSHKKIANQVESKRIDILINNAGFGIWDEFDHYELKKDIEMINLNVLSVVKLTKILLEKFEKQGFGEILNVGSTAAFQPGPLSATYFSTKSFVVNFSLGVYYELKKRGSKVFISVLCPGPTKTNFGELSKMNDTTLGKSLMASEEVVRYALKKFENKKPLIIPGLKNRLLAFSNRFSALNMLLGIIYKMNKKS